MNLLKQLVIQDGVDRSEEANALKAVAAFAEKSAVLEDWDFSPRQQSLEARMEELLVKCGYDKMKMKVPRDSKETVDTKGKGKEKESK